MIMNLGANAVQAIGAAAGKIEIGLENVEVDGGRAEDLASRLKSANDRHFKCVASSDGRTTKIWAGLLESGSYLKLKVHDTGCGMDRMTANRIFDPFFTTKDADRGVGLGLAAVYDIVTGHSGAIVVETVLGRGTTFEVYLRRVESFTDVGVEENSAHTEARGGERILFVDDEESIVELARRSLRRLGYQVSAMTSSTEALDTFRAHPEDWDLVITDLSMPKMMGTKLAREILKTRSDIPIILCTGVKQSTIDDNAKALGIREVITKPLEGPEFAGRIRAILDSDRTHMKRRYEKHPGY